MRGGVRGVACRQARTMQKRSSASAASYRGDVRERREGWGTGVARRQARTLQVQRRERSELLRDKSDREMWRASAASPVIVHEGRRRGWRRGRKEERREGRGVARREVRLTGGGTSARRGRAHLLISNDIEK